MRKRTIVVLMATVVTLVSFQSGRAKAQPAVAMKPVTLKGYVAKLTGEPHEQPDITVRVRSVKKNQEIAARTVDKDGYFEIPIDPNDLPPEDVRLSITAAGTAYIDGVLTPVRTDGTVYSLAGIVVAKTKPGEAVTEFIVLVVPKAEECVICGVASNCRRHLLFRSRR